MHRVNKRYLAVYIALIMMGSVSASAFAASSLLDEDAPRAPSALLPPGKALPVLSAPGYSSYKGALPKKKKNPAKKSSKKYVPTSPVVPHSLSTLGNRTYTSPGYRPHASHGNASSYSQFAPPVRHQVITPAPVMQHILIPPDEPSTIRQNSPVTMIPPATARIPSSSAPKLNRMEPVVLASAEPVKKLPQELPHPSDKLVVTAPLATPLAATVPIAVPVQDGLPPLLPVEGEAPIVPPSKNKNITTRILTLPVKPAKETGPKSKAIESLAPLPLAPVDKSEITVPPVAKEPNVPAPLLQAEKPSKVSINPWDEEADSNITPAPVAPPPPTLIPEPVEPPPTLTPETKKILANVPAGLDAPKTIRTPDPVIIKREDPNAGMIPKVDVRAHEEMGMKIEVRKATVNVNEYLEQGYDNLVNGKIAIAEGYYRQALDVDPANPSAQQGLATVYQKAGKADDAQALYAEILSKDPENREALNNFMALISNKAPEEAATELEKMEQKNPDFSPIPAQLGVVYNKMNLHEKAAEKLARALDLEPKNVAYKYNLAVTMDLLGKKEEAADLYLSLVQDYNNGATLPGDVQEIRNRAIYLSSAK